MNSSVEETKYNFAEVEHEVHTNGSKKSKVEYDHFAFLSCLFDAYNRFKVQDDIARLERAVNALQVQVGKLSDERRLLKDNYDRLKRDNQRRMWEITKLQGENRDVKEKCDKIQQENLTLKTKSTEFRVAIKKLQATNRDVKDKCEQIERENLVLKTKGTQFQVAINKLQAHVRDHCSLITGLQDSLHLIRSSKK
ncbi:uncharacterized protein TrAtP1_009498 [Trichoderma atroviride]|uniref:uncharacterized protein n=1 Tax=Hypocrea atroviridis TaxID=63577 RepID=UPI003322E27A|nr:hypothetical protein TrAtP1_009498 [Trichoderma atroviride]